jgi:hypothetical protein
MPQAGLLIQMDGSHHPWLEDRGPWLVLLAAIDDATGRVLGAVFRLQEDTHGYFLLLRRGGRPQPEHDASSSRPRRMTFSLIR